ncbi:M48 family metallopeptidase [Puniceicoccales bacterium CK1056]|uniref:M48 family metallopeptidase n=1 Tax=Oceanipulchritudo coccoides TaxID=2706888 RepID=A0A6B2LWL5_9BACT|nr:M48 family metallopeptidase [Oceanipulchritudo coccoides]NDV60868.1 M48 family metallopeptidase [Oceanipulchritudo coccoides]
MKRLLYLFLLVAFCGCASGPTFFSEDYLAGMAATEFSKIKEQFPISNDPAGTAMVNRVSSRIAQTLGDEMPDADWEYVLLEDEAANAFAMPGGKIAVFTGLLELVDSDDELAAVVGHEIAHVLLKHANQRMSAELIRGGIGVLVAVGTSEMEDENRALALAAYGIGSQVGIMLPYSRSHETQSDRMGLIIAARSGFDPRAAITFWKKMAEASSSSLPEFLSTHPGYETRIETLTEAMPEALRYYQASKRP